MIIVNKIIEKNSIINIYQEDVSIDINAKCIVEIYHYVIDKDTNIKINLNCQGACIYYHYSNINYNDHIVNIKIYHNEKNTISNFYNHGVNVLDNNLSFLVDGIISKDMDGSICNQENQIINVSNGRSTICPNLLIDCYDVNSSHSAYIGNFNLDKLFYLQSRGLTIDTSYHLLIKGFLIQNKNFKDLENNNDFKVFLDEILKIRGG